MTFVKFKILKYLYINCAYSANIRFIRRSMHSTSYEISDLMDILKLVKENKFVMFSLSHCPFCKKAKDFFNSKNITPIVVEIDKCTNQPIIRSSLLKLTGQRTFPNIFAYSNHLGGCDDVLNMEKKNIFNSSIEIYEKRRELENSNKSFDYEYAVIGGGSGGIACAKELAEYSKKVVLFDFVVPSPQGTKWGLGGTCVNVGCIPKKLMHQASIHKEDIIKSKYYGINIDGNVTHDWNLMSENIHNYIKSLNFAYRGELMSKDIKYINSFASLKSKHEILYKDSSNNDNILTAKYVILGMGERPEIPDLPGKEYCITSDDFFWLKYPPGKTLIVGASYVALECAGVLHGMGYDVTVMVRSIFLRGYDQEMAEKVGSYMTESGIKFYRPSIPLSIECIKKVDDEKCIAGEFRVKYKINIDGRDEIREEIFNTVMFAIGRKSCTENIGLENLNIKTDSKGRIISVDNREQTICENIFSVGDILSGKPQLTPVAIKAGQLLARRLSGKTFENCDYSIVPTTIFTPIEYGALGYSEEDAIKMFGQDDIEVYINTCVPLEEKIVDDSISSYYFCKIICRISQNNKVIGLHILAPHAGEIVQGYAVAFRMGATLTDFNLTFGIHPTISEVFTSMKVSKKSNETVKASGC